MSSKIMVGRSLDNLETTPRFDPYSKVTLTVSEDVTYTAGDDTGRELIIDCPWGTQQIANDLLKKYKGFSYCPYTASGAIMDPAAEIGDAAQMGSVYGGIYQQETHLGGLTVIDFSAPQDEETNHEYPYSPKGDRKIVRKFSAISSEFKVQAGLIAAKVEKTGGDPSSFSWEMESNHHSWYSNGVEVVRFEHDNFKFEGTIKAKAGLIGGFTIESNYLHTGNGTFDDCGYGDIYLGPLGINISNNFKVDSLGHLDAESGTFRGIVSAGNISYGGNDGYFDGYGITGGTITNAEIAGATILDGNIDYNTITGGSIAYGTVTTGNTSSGINTSLGNGDYASAVCNGNDTAPHLKCQTLTCWGEYIGIGSHTGQWIDKTIGGVTIHYFGHY